MPQIQEEELIWSDSIVSVSSSNLWKINKEIKDKADDVLN